MSLNCTSLRMKWSSQCQCWCVSDWPLFECLSDADSILYTLKAFVPFLMLLSFTSSMSGREFIAQRKFAFHVLGSGLSPGWYFPKKWQLKTGFTYNAEWQFTTTSVFIFLLTLLVVNFRWNYRNNMETLCWTLLMYNRNNHSKHPSNQQAKS